MCQSRKISHTRDEGEEVEEERKRNLRREVGGFITHSTER